MLALLLLASCGGGESDPTAGKSEEQLRREIEAVATPPVKAEDKPPPFRLRPLRVREVSEFVAGRPACFLAMRGPVMFVAAGAEGLANIDSRVRRLAASGPVGGSGGFFTAEGATISIGRVGQYAGSAAAYAPFWRAEVAIGGGKEIKPQEFEGEWSCRSGAAAPQ